MKAWSLAHLNNRRTQVPYVRAIYIQTIFKYEELCSSSSRAFGPGGRPGPWEVLLYRSLVLNQVDGLPRVIRDHSSAGGVGAGLEKPVALQLSLGKPVALQVSLGKPVALQLSLGKLVERSGSGFSGSDILWGKKVVFASMDTPA